MRVAVNRNGVCAVNLRTIGLIPINFRIMRVLAQHGGIAVIAMVCVHFLTFFL